MNSNRDQGIIIYILIFINSAISSAISLAISLKTFDVTKSVSYVSLIVLLYNISYVLVSWSWTKALPEGKDVPRKLLFLVFMGYLISSISIGLSDTVHPILIGSIVLGSSSAIASPLLMSILGSKLGKDYLVVTRYNLISSIASAAGYSFGWLSGNVELLLTSLAFASLPAFLAIRFLSPTTMLEFKKELHIPHLPNVTGRVKGAVVAGHSHTLIYEFQTLIKEFLKMFKVGIARELQLLLVGTALLFTAISTYFTPFPAFLKSGRLSDSDIFMLNLTSSVTSILGFRMASNVIRTTYKAWFTLRLCISLRFIVFSIPILSFTLLSELSIIKVFVGLFYVLIGITWAFISSSLTTLILSLSEPHRKGERLGHMNAAIGFGTILGSLTSAYVGAYGILMNYFFVIMLLLVAFAVISKASKTLVT